ncbi:MAG: hypothetical protein U0894_10225 [Pirellulales bacterium]
MSESTICIVDGVTKQAVDAILYDQIEQRHLDDFESKWKPWRAKVLQGLPTPVREESSHWEWSKKQNKISGLLAYPSFAVECCNETQGLMIVNTMSHCRLDSQRSKPLVYVEFLETAPWNREQLSDVPRYKRVGPVLIDVAIQLSISEGFEGRLGLHSLPQSDGWYRDKCKMTDLGLDPRKNMTYFEMTPEQARAFVGDS